MRWLLPFVFVLGCAHAPPPIPGGVTPLTDLEYSELVRKNTSKTNQYSGFYQTFQADMTILTNEMKTASLRQQGYLLQWSESQFNTEREKVLQENSAYAKFFLRFYSPERDYDDLAKGEKSIWKVYLDARGQRFEGKVRKMTEKFVELKTIYPFFDRFSTPYEITFNVPMTTIETGPCKVTLASTLGTAEFSFPPTK